MDDPDISPEQKLFSEFCRDPKNPTVEIIQGSHRFISLAMKNGTGTSAPKKSTLSDLFQEFMTMSVKQYIFNRIPRTILLELALCVLQDIASRGVSRAKTLRLEVVKTTAGGKTIAVANDDNPETGHPATNPTLAEDATFLFVDNSGRTPDVAFSIGKNHRAPYQQPDKQVRLFLPRESSQKPDQTICKSK